MDAVTSWPPPCSARGLHGFLSLAGYYCHFIKDFGAIAAPLTQLLRKDSFLWFEAAAAAAVAAFAALKQALSMASVLQLPDFEQPFNVDCDTSDSGFDVVLHQGTGAIAFFSCPFASRHMKLAAYE